MPHVSIRICLTASARHNVQTIEGRFAASPIPDAGRDAEVLYIAMHTRMLFFTTFHVGKGLVCKLAGILGSGRRVGGREWEREVTLSYLKYRQNHIKPHVGLS